MDMDMYMDMEMDMLMDMVMDMGREEQRHASKGDTVPALLLIDVRRNHERRGGKRRAQRKQTQLR
jgi:hypothetical protein